MKKLLPFLICFSVAIGVAIYLLIDSFHSNESKRREMTSLELNANDPAGNLIGFANALF